MGAEPYCVDECPDELKLIDSSVTNGTCQTCAEATRTEENFDGERPFWNLATETCVISCEQTSVNSVCVTCKEADSSKSFFNKMT